MRPWKSNIPFAATVESYSRSWTCLLIGMSGTGRKAPFRCPRPVKVQYGGGPRPSEFAMPTKSSAWQPAEGATGPLQPGPQSGHRINSAHEDLFRVHRCWRPILYRCRPEDRRDAPRKRTRSSNRTPGSRQRLVAGSAHTGATGVPARYEMAGTMRSFFGGGFWFVVRIGFRSRISARRKLKESDPVL